MSEVKCYNCGKVVQEADLTVKNVSTGMFSSDRKSFHNDCYKKYRATKMKKDLIEYTALADGLLLIFGIFMVAVSFGIASYAVLGSTIAIAIGLGYAWFKLEK